MAHLLPERKGIAMCEPGLKLSFKVRIHLQPQSELLCDLDRRLGQKVTSLRRSIYV